MFLASKGKLKGKLSTKREKEILEPLWFQDFLLAAGEGFEPSHTESESAVLPLHKPAISRALVSTQIIIPKQAEKSREKAKNF